MKSTSTIIDKGALVLRATLMAGALLAVACGGTDNTTPTTKEADASPKPATVKEIERIQIRTPDNESVVVFRLTPQDVQITFKDDGADGKQRILRTRFTAGKQARRYNEAGVGPVALVRAGEGAKAFTLRSTDNELRWRVMLGPNVIVARDHPELPGFELRTRDLQKKKPVRVFDAEKNNLGMVTFKGNNIVRMIQHEGETLYRSRSDRLSTMYGVLLVPGLDSVERYVMMAELLVQNR